MKDDVRVLTIGLEAFGDDYDLTCTRIYDFLMRGNDEFAKKLPLSRFLRATSVGKHPKNSNHVGDLDEKEVARGIIDGRRHGRAWGALQVAFFGLRYHKASKKRAPMPSTPSPTGAAPRTGGSRTGTVGSAAGGILGKADARERERERASTPLARTSPSPTFAFGGGRRTRRAWLS